MRFHTRPIPMSMPLQGSGVGRISAGAVRKEKKEEDALDEPDNTPSLRIERVEDVLRRLYGSTADTVHDLTGGIDETWKKKEEEERIHGQCALNGGSGGEGARRRKGENGEEG
jgi:hypothetical protein